MKKFLFTLALLTLVMVASAQEAAPTKKNYERFYVEINPIGASTLIELVSENRKQIVIPKSAELGFHFRDDFNLNIGFESDWFSIVQRPITPFFMEEDELFSQTGFILYMGTEYFLLDGERLRWNIGSKFFYGDFNNQRVLTDPDLAERFSMSENGFKVGFGFDMVFLIPLSKHIQLSVNPIALNFARKGGERVIIDENVMINERINVFDFELGLFSQIGIRCSL